MSAARWRQAMNSSAATAIGQSLPTSSRLHKTNAPGQVMNAPVSWEWLRSTWDAVSARHVAVLLFVLCFPIFATPFMVYQIGAQSLILGIVALSLTLLGGYGGMVSLAQMTIAGIAGYTVAILGVSGTTEISLGWPWWIAVAFALVLATIVATVIGWLSVRTEGIYTIMITVAIGAAFYYLALQNYSVFNGFQGIQKVYPPKLAGIDWRSPVPFYLVSLFFAMASYFGVKHLVRTPFGIALQGTRDNSRRMNSLGFNVVAHRVAAYAVAGFIAAVGGILLVWYNGLISPGNVNTGWLINILVIAVLGGMRHPIGAFLGAIIFVLLQTFAIDLIDRERFNLVIGGVFLAVVLFSPDGLLGLWTRIRARLFSSQATGIYSRK
jgi:branched-chain amino acid transport system permease protein